MKLLLGTRKGLIIYNSTSSGWVFESQHFVGIGVSMIFCDERTGKWWTGLSHGHWGQKLHVSEDKGKNWTEVKAPAYAEGTIIKDDIPAKLNLMWAMERAGDNLYIGTEPGGLFRSSDDGQNWELLENLWNNPDRPTKWFGGGYDHPAIHSIEVDPRDDKHLYIGISCAGVYESKDRGDNWQAMNSGLVSNFLPNQTAKVGHDPHLLRLCKSNPDVLWQQAHCGVWRSTDGSASWQEVSDKDKGVDFGFNICIDDNNPDRAWVIPGVSDEIRLAIDGQLYVAGTKDGGQTWTKYTDGLPQTNSYDIVYRHAMDRYNERMVFGTTTGNVFTSNDDGKSWDTVSNFLPMIHVVKMIE